MAEKRFELSLNNNRSIDIEFENITYSTKEKGVKKNILNGVSGKFISGELTAIMGPSGAGKTTLLNILTGFQVKGTKGTIRCNTVDKKKNGALQYKKQSCYILQDDNLPPLFTVMEIMNMAVKLKLKDISEKATYFLIDDILDNLSLINSKKTRCQDLSGGQRKRLSVALELINNPPIMFLDEPTTGLDSSSSSQCVHMLKNLALSGRTIICTIHQPSASLYKLFDYVYIMAEGKCVYQGSSANTIAYLTSVGFNCPQYHNPADYFLEVVSGEYGNYTNMLEEAARNIRWRRTVPSINLTEEKEYDKNEDRDAYNAEEESTVFYGTPSEWTRFWILLNRCRIQIFRDWTISHLKIVLHLLVGIFLGLTYDNSGHYASKAVSNLSFMICSLVYLAYTSLMPAILKFPSELPVLKKERFNNWYKLKTYYAAFLIYDIPMQMTFSLAYTTMSYFITCQPYELKRFSMVLFIQTLVALSSSSLGLVLGTVVNPINGTFFGAIMLAVMLSVAGVLLIFTHMSSLMYLLTYVSFLSFAMEGLMQAIYGYGRAPLECPESIEYCHYKSPEMFLEVVGMNKPNYWIDVGYLVITVVILRTIAFYTLRRSLSSS